MKISSLEINNFKSFKHGYISFDSFKSAGFYYVTGKNLEKPRLGANGSGKSTIIDSIVFCFFNKTPNNLMAENISSWKFKGETSVIVTLNENDVVKRTWNPNSLTLNGNIISQEELEKYIGYNFKSFLYSVVVPQFSTKFFDLDPSEKLKIFSDIIGDEVQKWEDYAEYAKFKSESLETLIASKSLDIKFIEGKIEQLNKQDLSSQIEEWSISNQNSIDILNNEINKKGLQVKELKEDILVLKEEREILEDSLDTYKILSKYEDEIIELKDRVELQGDKCKKISWEQTLLEKELNKLKNLSGESKCSRCNQLITEEHLEEEKELLEKEIVEKKKEISIIEELYNVVEKCLVEKTDNYFLLKNEQEKLEEKLNNILKSLKEYPSSISSLEEEITSALNELNLLKNKKNPFLNMEEKNKTSIKVLNRRFLYFSEELSNLKNKFENYKFWIKGYREIRLLVVEEATKELEININNNLQKMGMEDWEVIISTDAMTKKGTIKNKFVIKVKSPYNDKLVPFEVWSGGEGQRLRLAGTFGLIDFINNRRGTSSNIELMDEPSAWLSEEGVEDILYILKERAKEENRMIFLIDQRKLEKEGLFTGVITVVKDKDEGSLITIT